MNQKEHPWEECVTDAGCGHRGRGEGDICGVLTPSSDFSGLSSEGGPGKDPHAGQANVTLYVHALEIPQEALPRMGWAAGDQDIIFYADYGRFIGRNPIWVQGTLPTLVRMFGWVGLCTKLGKTKSMTCTPRLIWGQLGKGVYKRRATNEGDTFRERKRTRLSRNNCGRTMG